MSEKANIETIQGIYAAFSKGDVPTIMSRLTEDVIWEYNTYPNPAPWLQTLQGRSNVPRFFQALGAIELTQFEPRQFFGSESTVVDLVDVTFTIKATGKKVVEPEAVHIWHFTPDGRVAKFRHRVDTWQIAQALRE